MFLKSSENTNPWILTVLSGSVTSSKVTSCANDTIPPAIVRERTHIIYIETYCLSEPIQNVLQTIITLETKPSKTHIETLKLNQNKSEYIICKWYLLWAMNSTMVALQTELPSNATKTEHISGYFSTLLFYVIFLIISHIV